MISRRKYEGRRSVYKSPSATTPNYKRVEGGVSKRSPSRKKEYEKGVEKKQKKRPIVKHSTMNTGALM